ncbi:MAG TPA: hypothetical protein VN028_08865, partial [Rhodocyclaceae bacterium]|nr:hypothetical protein [Rhodocyclaceae bacterium]
RRAQNDSIDRFAAALAASPQDQVRVLQRPFDTDSGKAFKGSSELYDERQSLGFSVRYWRKLQP